MQDYLNIGPTPCDENCIGIGHAKYFELSRIECVAFKHQLEREFPNCIFKIKSFPHDFGMYREVIVLFDDDVESSFNNAVACESCSERWDSLAIEELEKTEYFKYVNRSYNNE